MSRKKITKEQRHDIFLRFHGRCAYCGCGINEDKFEVDHVEAIRELGGEILNKDNDNLDNLFPSCCSCNRLKSSLPLEYFRKKIENQVAQFERDSANFRLIERFEQIKIVPKPVIFFFELVK